MDLIYTTYPAITIATNTFVNVGTIIQFEDTPLFEVKEFQPTEFTTRLTVFHSDGTKIAVVKGSQLYLTEEGKKATIKLRHEPNLTACELEGRTILELRRKEAAALHGWAELHTPDGALVKALDAGLSAIRADGTAIKIGGMVLKGCLFKNLAIGIHVRKTGISVG